MFTSGIGTPIEPRRITREFHALLKKAGLPTIRLMISDTRARLS